MDLLAPAENGKTSVHYAAQAGQLLGIVCWGWGYWLHVPVKAEGMSTSGSPGFTWFHRFVTFEECGFTLPTSQLQYQSVAPLREYLEAVDVVAVGLAVDEDAGRVHVFLQGF